ncbi:protein kinase activating protein dpb11 [Dimargaris verticillata]|uniref:Protein kinase activating protein dpb11 n=1 Tax=Dimargaris verticillata TaxID=2761393 RepID=A0A9W8AYX9_9FUNG|nr:protein kinase activating protein dpb11 [Dimargaris verticillata]
MASSPLPAGPLDGYLVCSTGLALDHKRSLAQRIIELGGEYTGDYTEDVNILLAEHTGSEKYKLAVRVSRPIVHPDWVVAHWEAHQAGARLDREQIIATHLLPPFAGCRVHLTGFRQLLVRQKIQLLITGHGGRYMPSASPKCTHLVAYAPEGQKYVKAQQWNVHVVSLDWVLDSVKMKACADEALYPVQPPQNSGAQTATSKLGALRISDHLATASTAMALSSNHSSTKPRRRLQRASTTPVSTSARPQPRTAAYSQREEYCPSAVYPFDDEPVDMVDTIVETEDFDPTTPLSKAPEPAIPRPTPYLEACHIVFGEGFSNTKLQHLQRIIREGGGTWHSRLSHPQVTHYIPAGPQLSEWDRQSLASCSDGQFAIVNSRWLRECYHQRQCVAETPFLLSTSPTPRPKRYNTAAQNTDLDEPRQDAKGPAQYSPINDAHERQQSPCPGSGTTWAGSASQTRLIRPNDTTPIHSAHYSGPASETPTPAMRQSTWASGHRTTAQLQHATPRMAALLGSAKKPTTASIRRVHTTDTAFVSEFSVDSDSTDLTSQLSNRQTSRNGRPMGSPMPSQATNANPADANEAPMTNGNNQELAMIQSHIFADKVFTSIFFPTAQSQVIQQVVTNQGGNYADPWRSLTDQAGDLSTVETLSLGLAEWLTCLGSAYSPLACPVQLYVVVPLGGAPTTRSEPNPLLALWSSSTLATAAAAARVTLYVVTECWLERCVESRRVLPTGALPTFTPLLCPLPVPQCQTLVIGISGYEGLEREHLLRLIECLGAQCTEKFSRKNTHLLCPHPSGPKFAKAQQWGRSVVDAAWIYDLVRRWVAQHTAAIPLVVGASSTAFASKPTLPEINQPNRSATKPTSLPSDDPHLPLSSDAPSPAHAGTPIHLNFYETWTPVPTPHPHGAATQKTPGLTNPTPMNPEQTPLALIDDIVDPDHSEANEHQAAKIPMGSDGQALVPEAMPTAASPMKHTLVPNQGSAANDLHTPATGRFDLTGVLLDLKTPMLLDTSRRRSLQGTNGSVLMSTSMGGTPLDKAFHKRLHHALQSALGDSSPESPLAEPSLNTHTLGPFPRPTPPRVSPRNVLKDVTLCFSSKLTHRRSELADLARQLGAQVVWSLGSTCTHYVHQGSRTTEGFKEFRQAKKMGLPIVSPWWLYRCYEEGRRLPEVSYPHTFNPCMILDLQSALETPQLADNDQAPVTLETESSDPASNPLPAPSSPPGPKITRLSPGELPVSPPAATLSPPPQPPKDFSTEIESLLERFGTSRDPRSAVRRRYRDPDGVINSPRLADTLAFPDPTEAKGASGQSLTKSSDTTSTDDTSYTPAPVRYHDPEAQRAKQQLLNQLKDGLSQAMGPPTVTALTKRLPLLSSTPTTDSTRAPTGGLLLDTKSPYPGGPGLQLLDSDASAQYGLDPKPSAIPLLADIGTAARSERGDGNSAPFDPQAPLLTKPSPAPLISGAAVDPSTLLSTLTPPLDASATESQALANVSPPKRVFQFSSVPPTRRKRFTRIVDQLGGKVVEHDGFSQECTHLVVGYLTRSEKVIASIAAGIWVLEPKFLEESANHGQFLDETKYQWTDEADIPPDEASLALAVRQWRQALAEVPQVPGQRVGAFSSWRTLVCATGAKQASYERLLEAGGATVTTLKLAEQREQLDALRRQTFTHFIVEKELGHRLRRDMLELMVQEKRCLAVTTEFIVQFLLIDHDRYPIPTGLPPWREEALGTQPSSEEVKCIELALLPLPFVNDAFFNLMNEVLLTRPHATPQNKKRPASALDMPTQDSDDFVALPKSAQKPKRPKGPNASTGKRRPLK